MTPDIIPSPAGAEHLHQNIRELLLIAKAQVRQTTQSLTKLGHSGHSYRHRGKDQLFH